MHLRIIRLLTGYISIVILTRNTMLSVAHPCTVDSINGTLRALCNNKGLLEVPQDLNDTIQHLDLSGNSKMQTLTADSLKKFKSLTYLSLKNCNISSDIGAPFTGFKPLDKLEELDIGRLHHEGATKQYDLPNSLKILKMDYTDIGDLVVPDLLKLDYVDLSGNLQMSNFPLFHAKARVQTLIMLNVNVPDLTVMKIAEICYLKKLDLSIAFLGGSRLLEPNRYCICIFIHRWIKQFNIESNLRNNPDDMKCRKPEADSQKSDLEICPKDDAYHQAQIRRDQCLNVAQEGISWLWIFGGVLILLLLGMIIVMFILDIRIAAHIRYAHSVLMGKNKENDDDEEAPSEDQPSQDEQVQPEEQKE